MITIGIIGTGFGARVQLPALLSLKNVRVIGIAGKNHSEAKAIAIKYEIQAFSTWQELASDPSITAIIIATPPALHAQMVLFALQHGKHILCEKPLALSLEEATKMTRFAAKKKLVTMTDFEFRNIPEWIAAKKIIDAGKIGSLRYVNIAWLTGGKAGNKVTTGWRAREASSGGILSEFGSHVIDYISWFFGPTKEVSASIRNIKDNNQSGPAHDACDILLRLTSGVLVNIAISNVVHGGRGHAIEIYGSEGTLKIENRNLADSIYGFELYQGVSGQDMLKKISIHNSFSEFKKVFPDGRAVAFREIAKNFVGAIEKNKKITPSFEDGLRAQRIVEAARLSAKQKRWMPVR